jgi:hypothetical protein
MNRGPVFLMFVFLTLSALSPMMGQSNASAADTVVPSLVNYSGKAIDAQGKPVTGIVGVTFAIYKDETDGGPLWMETQNVQADARGNFSVQLGATKPGGLTLELFQSGDARWLGVRINGGEEQPRVLLLSVPYALKAADAQTLGGLPPSAFVLASPVNNSASSENSCANISSPAAQGSTTSQPSSNVGGSGTQNYIPLWTDNSGDLGNSILYQSGTGSSAKIGINLKNPLFTLDVNGQESVHGLFEMATTGYATASKGFNSNPLNLESSAFNSNAKKYTVNHFQWQAEPTGNNTTAPGATLNLLYGTDPNLPAETGLKLSSKGIFTFAAGQSFPGAGTVTRVALSAPSSDFTVSGSPVTGTGTLGLNWTIVPTSSATASAIVKRDSSGSFSAGAINASLGVVGLIASGNGVYGESDGSASGSNGVEGVTFAGPGSGVVGLNNSSSGGLGVYGNGGNGSASTGVYGTGTVGVWGTGSSYGFATDSNVQQARTAAGWVKAIAVIQGMNAPYSITSCFNSYLTGAAATTPPCGFNLTEVQPGVFTIDFGFQVSDRFLSVTGNSSPGLSSCPVYASTISTDVAKVLCWDGSSYDPYVATVFVF